MFELYYLGKILFGIFHKKGCISEIHPSYFLNVLLTNSFQLRNRRQEERSNEPHFAFH